MRADMVEQVFLKRQAGVYQVLLVLESAAGRRERVNLTAPSGDERATVDFVARYLLQRGASLAARPRLRVETGDGLSDAPLLLERLVTAVTSGVRVPVGGLGPSGRR